MNIKKLIITGLAATMLIAGAAVVGAQDDTTNAEPEAPVSESSRRGAFREGGRFDIGLGSGLYRELITEYTGLDEAALREALGEEGATLASLIEANGQRVDDFIAAATASAFERIDEAVAAGNLTEERAEEMKVRITDRATEAVNGTLERRMPGGRDGARGGRLPMFDGAMADLVTEYTGMEAQDVAQAMRDGETLNSLIEANGQRVDDFIAEAVTVAEAEIDARTEERKANLTETITAIVNGEFERGGRFGGGRGN